MGALVKPTSTRRAGKSLVRMISNVGDVTLIPFQVTFSNSYATGGDTGFLAASDLPTSAYNSLLFTWVRPVQGYTFSHDVTNDKLIAYVSGNTQVTSTTDLSALPIRGLAFVTGG